MLKICNLVIWDTIKKCIPIVQLGYIMGISYFLEFSWCEISTNFSYFLQLMLGGYTGFTYLPIHGQMLIQYKHQYFEQSHMGEWCPCQSGFGNMEDEMEEHFRAKIRQL